MNAKAEPSGAGYCEDSELPLPEVKSTIPAWVKPLIVQPAMVVESGVAPVVL